MLRHGLCHEKLSWAQLFNSVGMLGILFAMVAAFLRNADFTFLYEL